MDAVTPTRDQWRKLYEAAIAIKDLGPWEWMLESDVFGFRAPVADRLDFISIMGMRGEHLSVAVYLGDRAVVDFFRLETSDEPPAVADMLEIPHLQASFEDRDLLEREDRAIIRQLGFKFRGRQAWPMFRSYRPGFFPWFVESDEVETLICALDQILDVAPRLKEDPFLLCAPDDDQSFLVRSPQPTQDGAAWSEQFVRVSPTRTGLRGGNGRNGPDRAAVQPPPGTGAGRGRLLPPDGAHPGRTRAAGLSPML